MLVKSIIAATAAFLVSTTAAAQPQERRPMSAVLGDVQDEWLGKAADSADRGFNKYSQHADDAMEDEDLCTCLFTACCSSNSEKNSYFAILGAKFLVGSTVDVVMNYRYYYCQELPAFKTWESKAGANGRGSRFSRWKNWWRTDCGKRNLWEKSTGLTEYTDIEDSSAMRQCGLTWEQYDYMRDIDDRKKNFDGRYWHIITDRSLMPEVVEEEEFWIWAQQNRSEISKKYLWD